MYIYVHKGMGGFTGDAGHGPLCASAIVSPSFLKHARVLHRLRCGAFLLCGGPMLNA